MIKEKRKAARGRNVHSSDGLPYQQRLCTGSDDHRSDGKDEEKHAENDRNPKESLLNTTPGGKNRASVPTCHIAKASTLALQDDTDHQGN
jgi:hypothetical protein